jgi:hypothetical protein
VKDRVGCVRTGHWVQQIQLQQLRTKGRRSMKETDLVDVRAAAQAFKQEKEKEKGVRIPHEKELKATFTSIEKYMTNQTNPKDRREHNMQDQKSLHEDS